MARTPKKSFSSILSVRITSLKSSLINIFSSIKVLSVQFVTLVIGLLVKSKKAIADNASSIFKAVLMFVFLYLVIFNVFIATTISLLCLAHMVISDTQHKRDNLESSMQQLEWKDLISGFLLQEEIISTGIYEYFKAEDNGLKTAFLEANRRIGEYFDDPKVFVEGAQKSGIYMLHAVRKSDKSAVISIRGTDFDQLDNTASQVLDDQGTGATAFGSHKDNIIDELISKIEASSNHEAVSINGHSFGGAIAPLTLVGLMQRLVSDSALLPSLKEIKVSIFKPAGVNQTICDEADRLIESLSVSRPDLKIHFHVCNYDWDVVPVSGKQLFADTVSDNLRVVAVCKKALYSNRLLVLILRDLLTLSLNIFIPHSLPMFANPHTRTPNDYGEANKDVPMEYHVSSNFGSEKKTDNGKEKVSELFNATYTAFALNPHVHKFINWVGLDIFRAIKDLAKLALTFIFLLASISRFSAQQTLYNYFGVWASILSLIHVIPQTPPFMSSVEIISGRVCEIGSSVNRVVSSCTPSCLKPAVL